MTMPKPRLTLTRVLGRLDTTRLTIDGCIFDLSQPDLEQLAAAVLRQLEAQSRGAVPCR